MAAAEQVGGAAGQAFSVHPDDPRCFLFRGKPFKIITSAEHYGAVINADFDYEVYLQEMARTSQNMTRVFTFYREKAHSIPGPGEMNTLAPTPEGSVMPWLRIGGHGKAADGLNKLDLDQWNPAYFARLKDYVRECGNRGIVCEITLFCNPYNQEKYDLFPCSNVSNVNGVGGSIDDPREFMTLQDPTITAFQERFCGKMAAELNEFDNVYFEICNEPNIHGDFTEENERRVIAWHARLARCLRDAEAELPNRHLIAANAHFRVRLDVPEGEPNTRHDDQAYLENPDIDIINYHYISAKANARGYRFSHLPNEGGRAGVIWPFMRERDHFRKPIVFDETFSGIVRGSPERYPVNRAEAWEMLLSGGAGYNNLDWSFTPADETGSGATAVGDGRRLDGRPLREWLSILRGLLSEYDVAALVPAAELVPESIPDCGFAASTDGAGRYIVYLVDERVYRLEACDRRSLSVELKLPAGRYAVRALDPRTGTATGLAPLASDGTGELRLPEFEEDIAVILNRAE